jgi:serine/threonine protein kinase
MEIRGFKDHIKEDPSLGSPSLDLTQNHTGRHHSHDSLIKSIMSTSQKNSQDSPPMAPVHAGNKFRVNLIDLVKGGSKESIPQSKLISSQQSVKPVHVPTIPTMNTLLNEIQSPLKPIGKKAGMMRQNLLDIVKDNATTNNPVAKTFLPFEHLHVEPRLFEDEGPSPIYNSRTNNFLGFGNAITPPQELSPAKPTSHNVSQDITQYDQDVSRLNLSRYDIGYNNVSVEIDERNQIYPKGQRKHLGVPDRLETEESKASLTPKHGSKLFVPSKFLAKSKSVEFDKLDNISYGGNQDFIIESTTNITNNKSLAPGENSPMPFKRSGSYLNDSNISRINGNDSFLALPKTNGGGGLDSMNNISMNQSFSKVNSSVIHTNRVNKTVDEEGKKKINQYIIIKEVGKGGFGKVKLAIHSETQVQYAIKIANKKKLQKKMYTKNKSAFTQLESEIAIMKKLDHPSIVHLFEVIDDPTDSKLYLIMEYVKKGAVMSKAYWRYEENENPQKKKKTDEEPEKGRRLTVQKARKYFRELVLGLDYLHNHANVIHRDIKPENLLIDEHDHLKVSDFGISQIMEGGSDELSNNAGTKLFLAPETWMGKKFSGKPTDIWAAGGTLYYFLVGRPPFMGVTAEDLKMRICQEEPYYPEDLSDEIAELIAACLTKDPKERITLEQLMDNPWLTEEGRSPVKNTFEHSFVINEDDMKAALGKVQFRARIRLTAKLKMNLQKVRSKITDRKLQA